MRYPRVVRLGSRNPTGPFVSVASAMHKPAMGAAIRCLATSHSQRAQLAPVVHRVRSMSGNACRPLQKKPALVAKIKPARTPVSGENSCIPIRHVIRQRLTAARAEGRRAVHSVTPDVAAKNRAMAQKSKGGLSG